QATFCLDRLRQRLDLHSFPTRRSSDLMTAAIEELNELLADAVPPLEGAACAGRHDVDWYPNNIAAAEPAKRICATCPVRQQCLDYALETKQKVAVWCGLTERERSQRLPSRLISRTRKTVDIAYVTHRLTRDTAPR